MQAVKIVLPVYFLATMYKGTVISKYLWCLILINLTEMSNSGIIR